MFKRYVDVVVYHDKRGEIQPLFMKWENKTYKIEKTECMSSKEQRERQKRRVLERILMLRKQKLHDGAPLCEVN